MGGFSSGGHTSEAAGSPHLQSNESRSCTSCSGLSTCEARTGATQRVVPPAHAMHAQTHGRLHTCMPACVHAYARLRVWHACIHVHRLLQRWRLNVDRVVAGIQVKSTPVKSPGAVRGP